MSTNGLPLPIWAKQNCFRGKFGEAKSWFDNVIANGVTTNGLKYALLDSYSQIYNAENDNHAEAVMDVESLITPVVSIMPITLTI